MIALTSNTILIYQRCVSLLHFAAITSVYVCAQRNHPILLPKDISIRFLSSHPVYLVPISLTLDSGMKLKFSTVSQQRAYRSMAQKTQYIPLNVLLSGWVARKLSLTPSFLIWKKAEMGGKPGKILAWSPSLDCYNV